jgi:hypothetical protein
MSSILKALFCRHRFKPVFVKDETENRHVAVTLQYVGGFKTLHRCEKCERLKWIKVMDT